MPNVVATGTRTSLYRTAENPGLQNFRWVYVLLLYIKNESIQQRQLSENTTQNVSETLSFIFYYVKVFVEKLWNSSWLFSANLKQYTPQISREFSKFDNM